MTNLGSDQVAAGVFRVTASALSGSFLNWTPPGWARHQWFVAALRLALDRGVAIAVMSSSGVAIARVDGGDPGDEDQS